MINFTTDKFIFPWPPKTILRVFSLIFLPFVMQAQYYVSPEGSDQNPGTQAEPFQTIQKAAGIMIAGDTCFIREGIYRETVIPYHDGEPLKPIVFTNYNDERVVISGTVIVSNWEPCGNGIYKAFLPQKVSQLFVNGQPAETARFPNRKTTNRYVTDDWHSVQAFADGKVIFEKTNKPENYWNGALCKILTGKKWVAHVGKVVSSAGDSVLCHERSQPWNDRNPETYLGNGKGYLFNHLNALDTTGEWHWQNDTLYYFPESKEALERSKTEARIRNYGFDCMVNSFIEIKNLRFVASSVNFSDAMGCILDGCSIWYPVPFFFYENSWVRDEPGGNNYSIDHWPGKGITVSGTGNTIRNCYITQSWGDGISIGGVGNRVENSFVENCDWSATDAAAMSVTGQGHQITGNTLRTAARSILVHRYCGATRFTYNDLYDCGLMCNDLGLTYSYHTNGNFSVIAYNWVHDNRAGSTASGIYLDNYDSNYMVHHNVVWNCSYAIHTNKPAVNHKIYNNTVWFCDHAMWTWGRPGTKVEQQQVVNNLSDKAWDVGTFFKTNLTTDDPGFVDPARHDFRLQVNSPAIDFGTAIPGITNDSNGEAPDAGAYEFGSIPWKPGAVVDVPDMTDVIIGSTVKAMPVSPTPDQVAYQKMEMIGFIHFNINTFTNKEWGYGDESPELFNPTGLDVEQWVKTAQKAGIRQLILTAKHHDGFCLWPSAYTEHSVKNSPWKNGKGDVVKEFTDACHKYGMKAGLYLSPWDRNNKDYGTPEYITYYRNQVMELLTRYGRISEFWIDGANGGDGYYGGADEMRKIDPNTYYDWDSTFRLIRRLQPGIIIFSDKGPGCRWIGNEHGMAGKTNWSTITPDSVIIGNANTAYLNTGDPNGSRWIPGECDVSVRPGWFYHPSEDGKIKTLAELRDIYYGSVGRNGVLLLNIPPDRRGLIRENDVQRLTGFGNWLKKTFSNNAAAHQTAVSDNYRDHRFQYHPSNMLDENHNTFWAADKGVTGVSAEIILDRVTGFNLIVIGEFIPLGQRVSSFSVEALIDGKWETVATGTTIGYKRILKIPHTETNRLKFNIHNAKAAPLISRFELYNEAAIDVENQ